MFASHLQHAFTMETFQSMKLTILNYIRRTQQIVAICTRSKIFRMINYFLKYLLAVKE